MSTDAELIERLKDEFFDPIRYEAADRIAVLIAQMEYLGRTLEIIAKERSAAEAERDKLADAVRPALSKNARKVLEEAAEADEAVGDGEIAKPILLLLKWHDNARAALSPTQEKGK